MDETEYSIDDVIGSPDVPVQGATSPAAPAQTPAPSQEGAGTDYDISDLAVHTDPISRTQAIGTGAQQGLFFGYGPQVEAYRRAYDDLLKQGKVKPPQFPVNPFPGAPPVILPIAEPTEGYDKSILESPEYQFYLDQERNKVEATKQKYPYSTFGGEVAGSTANPATWAFPELKAGQYLGNMLKMALPSSVYGFISGTSEGDTAEEKLKKGAEQAAVAGTVGGIAGGIATPFVSKTAPEGIKEAANKLSETGSPVELPRAVTGSQWQRSLGSVFAKLPFLRKEINQSAEKANQQISAKMDELSKNVDSYNAGSAAQDAMASWIVNSRKQIDDLYTAADKIIAPTPVPMSNTQQVLKDIIAKRKSAFDPGSAPGAKPYDPSAGLDFISGPVSNPAGKSYQDIKLIRTTVGEMLKTNPEGVAAGELRQLYGALTNDLEHAAQVGGGQLGYSQWKQANTDVKAFKDALDEVEGYFGKIEVDRRTGNAVFDRNPEKFTKAIVSAAQGNTQNLDKLVLAKSIMDPKSWDFVAQAAVADLGKEGQGATAVFDPQKFLKQYSSTKGFSPRAKDILFGTTGTPLRDSLDSIATISQDFDQITSLRAKERPWGGLAAEAGAMVLNPVKTIAFMVGSKPLAIYLSRPDTAKAASNFAKAYTFLAKNPTSEAAQIATAQAIKNMPMIAGSNMDKEQLLKTFAAIGVYSGPVVDEIQSFNPLNNIIGAIPSERFTGGRVARKSGGRATVNPISAEVKRVRTLLSEKTASMLSVPDDAIATALHIAKRT